MNLRQIRAFIAVAEELSFTRAASRLNVSQQPLSFTIRRLEDEIGLVLFERTTRKVALTDAGTVLLKEARKMEADIVDGIEAARRAARGEFGRLEVGYVNTALFSSLPRTLRRYRELYPGVSLTLHEMNSSSLEREVRDGGLQAAFLHPQLYLPEVNYQVLVRQPRVLVVPSGHPLEGRRQVRLQELRDEVFVSFARPADHPVPDPLVEICRHAGFLPKIAQKADTSMAIVGLVSVGLGVSIVPQCMTSIRRGEVVYIALAETDVTFDFAFATPHERPSVEARALAGVALEVAKDFTTEEPDALNRPGAPAGN